MKITEKEITEAFNQWIKTYTGIYFATHVTGFDQQLREAFTAGWQARADSQKREIHRIWYTDDGEMV